MMPLGSASAMLVEEEAKGEKGKHRVLLQLLHPFCFPLPKTVFPGEYLCEK
jgi:hypothetical protein